MKSSQWFSPMHDAQFVPPMRLGRVIVAMHMPPDEVTPLDAGVLPPAPAIAPPAPAVACAEVDEDVGSSLMVKSLHPTAQQSPNKNKEETARIEKKTCRRVDG